MKVHVIIFRIKNFDHLLKVLKPLLKFDISHMNAILRVSF